MRQTQAREEELKLEAERRIKYKGTCRIKLEMLYFRWNEPRELDTKNVEKLKACFRKSGCRRLLVQNHIPAIIDEQCLNTAIQSSGITAAMLTNNYEKEYPELILPATYQLLCLHGRHRIQAAKEYLSPRDKWWTVDLYLAGEMMFFGGKLRFF